jgi:superfamily II DNA helicase RecQ
MQIGGGKSIFFILLVASIRTGVIIVIIPLNLL